MLKDITIGQYFPGETPVHKLDSRTKLALTLAYIVALFLVKSLFGFLAAGAFLLAVILISKIKLKMILKSVRPIFIIVLFTAVINLFFTPGEPVKIWFFTITMEGVYSAVFMVLRIVLLVAGSSMLTYTTSPITLTDGLERLMSPLKLLRFPVHEFSMMMTIALRFIPTLIEETDKIMNAQKARGADFESGGIIKRAAALVPVLVPMFISAFRRADELALAMECRCYNGGQGRTKLNVTRFSFRDLAAFMIMAGVIAAIVALNML